MAQYGDQLITGTIIPFLADDLFGNVENDDLLKKAISFNKTLTETDRKTIVDKYSPKRNSVIYTDPKFKKIFWKELFSWIDTQKIIAGGDAVMLAKRLLPINPDGGYYPEAGRNFYKFGFQATKAYEFFLINEKIDKKFEKDSIDAKNEKAKLKKGDLLLLKKKDGTYDYFQKEQIRKSLESVTAAAELYNRVLTTQEGNNTFVFSFNPLTPAKESTVLDLNKQIWANKNFLIQRNLEQNAGLHVDGTPTVAENGLLSGIVVVVDQETKVKKTLKVEVDLASPAKKRKYTFTFTNPADKGKHFDLQEEQLDQFKQFSPNQILTFKQTGGLKREEQLPPPIAPIRPKTGARPSAGKSAEETKVARKNSEPKKEQLDQAKPRELPESVTIDQKYNVVNKFNNFQFAGEKKKEIEWDGGPIGAKDGFALNFNANKKQPTKYSPNSTADKVATNQSSKGGKSPKKKNPIIQLFKWHLIGFSTSGGFLALASYQDNIPK